MPNQISVNIAPVQRSSGFQSNSQIYAGGFSNLQGTLTGLGSGAGSDYENTANSIAMFINIDPTGGTNFTQYPMFTWQGGPVTLHGVTDPPPAEQFFFANVLPVGANFFFSWTITGTLTVGFSGTIS